MKRVTPQPSFGHDLSASLLDRFREYSVALNQCADHRLSEFVQVVANYTAGENDHVIECAPSGAMTVTLPAASVMRNKRIVVKRTNNTTHTVTIQGAAGNIDGAASVTLTTAHQSREVFSDGANWWLLDAGATAPTDPYWANVVLMLHFDGDLVDEKGHAFSADGTTFTASGKFADAVDIGGTAVTGGGANVVYLDTATTDLWLDGGDFTIEGWCKNDATNNDRPRTLVRLSYGTSDYLAIGISEVSTDTWYFQYRTGISTTTGASVGVPTPGQWFHLAYVRSGDTHYCIVNGTVLVTFINSYRIPEQAINCFIGNSRRSFVDALCGQIDDLRITKGVARYTSAFDVPTEAFPNQ